MPRGAAEGRAQVLATLAREIHRKTVDPRLGDSARAAAESPDTLTQDIGKYWLELHEDAVRLPEALVARMAEVSSQSEMAWQDAKTFYEMKSHLNELVNLNFEMASYFPELTPYDVLIDTFEKGMTQTYLDKVFAQLKPELLELRQRVTGASTYHKTEAIGGQDLLDFCKLITGAIGYDYEHGNLATTMHPFMSTVGPGDARIATSLDTSDPLYTVMGAIHEAGHAMYEQGAGYKGTGLDHIGSMGLHESQSLFAEIMVGKSQEFWEQWLPEFNKILTSPYQDVQSVLADLHRYNPTNVIRLQAGDLDYGLHILLRYDLERALFSKEITPFEMKDKFNALCQEYFGATPKDDRKEGVLQDVHWAAGWYGYFPSYLLGVSLSAQLKAMCPDNQYLPFLRGHVHQHGGRYTFETLTNKYLGGYSPKHYIDYLKGVYL